MDSYHYNDGRTQPSMADTFTLSPLPYQVLLLLLLVFLPLASSWYLSYEDMIEDVQMQISWVILLLPVILVFVIRWLSSVESPDFLPGLFTYGGGNKGYYNRNQPEEGGSSPWGVAAVVVFLLVLISFRSTFLDMWSPIVT